MKKQLIAASLALASAFSLPAFAEGAGFVRGEIGRSNIEVSAQDIGRGDDNDTTWGLRGGYWFNANVGVEGFYSQLYSASYNDGFDTYRLKLHGVGAGLVAKKNFGGEHTGTFISGRAGLVRGVATVEYGNSMEADAGSTKAYFGVGAGYDFSPKFGVSVNYDHMKSGGDGVDVTAKLLTLGFEARF